MKRFLTLFTAPLVLAMGTTAHAVIVFQDNFDSYADQTAFTTAWTPIGCQGQGTACTLNATSTTSNELNQDFAPGPNPPVTQPNVILNHSPAAPSPGTADLSERNQITFTPSPVLSNGDQLAFS